MENSSRILLHVCCAPCASASCERLLAEKKEVILYYSNSNIGSLREFHKRLDAVNRLSKEFKVPLLTDAYQHEKWLSFIAGTENEPEGGGRCSKCFAYSLGRASHAAEEHQMGSFTTSLTISPHKNTAKILHIGSAYKLYEHHDFKKKDGFKRSVELAKKWDLYRQDHCGCEFS